MDHIIRKYPYSDHQRTVAVPGGKEFITVQTRSRDLDYPTSVDQLSIASDTPRFPVLVDTGLSHNFSIKEEHVVDWAGVAPASLPKLGKSIINGVEIPQHNASIWIHRNRPGEADAIGAEPAFFLELDGGISISPRGINFPRIPCLGMQPPVSIDLSCGWIRPISTYPSAK